MVNLTNFFRQASKPDSVLNNKAVAEGVTEGVNLVKSTANALNENDAVANLNKAVTEGGKKIIDTAKNHKSLVEDITEHFPDFITQTGGKIINYAKENPFTYAAGAGVAVLTAGIVIGRISKSSDDSENI